MIGGFVARLAEAPRTQEERTGEAKSRLRNAALILFGRDGYDATTLSGISVAAGFSRTLAQYHYPDKSALALELLEERILRDNHLDLLDCAGAAAEEAWGALLRHLSAVTDYYSDLHGHHGRRKRLRGEMAIHAAALMGNEPVLSSRVGQLTHELVSRVEALLETCAKQGFIPRTTNTRAMAVLHVHSIWGLALALFANPKGERQVHLAFEQIAVLLERLRNSGHGAG